MHRVLVVDDNDAVRESLVDALSDEGFMTEGASDGALALRKADQSLRPSVILLDLMMPGLDGVTVAERLLQKGGSAPPVIVLSADRYGAELARKLGAAGFLAKPFDLDALVAMIQKVVLPGERATA
jgi:CheY-like chemotaxis protein